MNTDCVKRDFVKRDFVKNALFKELKTVPGIDEKATSILEKEGVLNTNYLVGNFFLLERDENKFRDFLIGLGIETKSASECAKNLYLKFISL